MDLIVRNFQSIKEAKFRVEGLTVLVGESSAGKSACLKAVQAAFTNRFKIGQVRHGEEYAEIKARVADDGRVLVVQRRPMGSPTIKLGDQVYSKLARSMPTEVQDFLNLGQLEVGGDIYSLNFHSQFDKPLLLAFSQKKVMEILAASKGIEDLNSVHYALSKKREQNRGAFNQVDAVLNENNAKMSLLKHDIAEIEESALKLQSLLDELTPIQSAIEALENVIELLSQYDSVISRLEKCESVISNCESVISLNSSYDQYADFVTNVRAFTKLKKKETILDKLINTCGNTASELLEYESLYNSIVEFESIAPRFEQLQSVMSVIEKIEDTQLELSESVQEQNDCDALLLLLDSNLQVSTRINELKKITEEKICPVCGSKFE